MTRLTSDVIKDVPARMSSVDAELERKIGLGIKSFACVAAGVREADISFEEYSVAVVPITSGKGIIRGFSDSTAAALEVIGMRPFVTRSGDVAGIAEAISSNADIIFMADDERFIALNMHSKAFSDNIWSTARGYVSALSLAEGTLRGKTVLVLGAGRVGSEAVRILSEEGSHVEVCDIIFSKAKALERYKNVKAREDLEQAISDNRLILNASPGSISGDLIQNGAIISSPGVPYAFDAVGEERAKTIIHDVLGLGVAVMAVASARTSLCDMPSSAIVATSEVLS